ncbi:hypothetical protein [Tenuibacillus multivorans]|uniref:CNNM transmembrane domain-containing protein n=1 Tax=Tenuibacillus multivorans TaxID=237069 RepID=A0A1G9Z7G4_9BACI|nr:hypothetical protein [Tenuibacillus multivorans]GEL77376.1 hypothetical protein TMU01_16110 [Tenuibacillus multivorans]SDN17025.1 hypothetical protein SAMN05216498_1564 [Tenuibacillus multivorans]
MNKNTIKKSLRFSISIAVITLVLAAIFSIASTSVLSGTSWAIGLIIVFIIVFIGVFFDMMGIAAAAASETPFHSMAAEKVPGSKQAIIIVRNADRFASFCNDVIGDIAGIVSGAASTLVVIQLAAVINTNGVDLQSVLNIILTSIVAALTVGGKAFGKTLAMTKSTEIILMAGKTVSFVERNLHIRLLPELKKQKK